MNSAWRISWRSLRLGCSVLIRGIRGQKKQPRIPRITRKKHRRSEYGCSQFGARSSTQQPLPPDLQWCLVDHNVIINYKLEIRSHWMAYILQKRHWVADSLEGKTDKAF